MRLRTISLALAAAAILVLGLAGTALALHDGGVAHCDACHTMHNSLNGQIMDSQLLTQFTAGPNLLKASDASSACLNCHGAGSGTSSYHVYTELADFVSGVPQQFSPGGDFTWLKVGTGTADAKAKKGHNIVAADFGLTVDTRLSTAPGGTYSKDNLGCQACHDPHGRYRITTAGEALPLPGSPTIDPIAESGSYGAVPVSGAAVGAYRLLGGNQYVPKSYTGGPAFTHATPAAIAPSTYNTTDGYKVRVAYGSGMSEWCANCHGGIHNDSYPTNLRHPASNLEKLPAAIVANYNAYKKSGDMSGVIGTAYDPLVPFEIGLTNSVADRALMVARAATDTGLGGLPAEGAATTNNVACVSCHRIHASGFESMMRWDQKATLIVDGGPDYVGTESNGINTSAQLLGAYYNRPASTLSLYQRSLCNKCHAKD